MNLNTCPAGTQDRSMLAQSSLRGTVDQAGKSVGPKLGRTRLMVVRNAAHRANRARRGFSLIEILVAILLIGILMAVAAPRLLGSREVTADSAAQQQLNTVALAATTIFSTKESFSGTDAAGLADDVPEVSLVAGPASLVSDTNVRQVSIAVTNSNGTWTAAALGGGGRCWFIRQDKTEPDKFAVLAGSNTTCDAATQAPAAGSFVAYGFPAGE